MHEQLAILRPEGAKLRTLPQPVRVVGIDLGTTNSTVGEITWYADRSDPIKVRCLEVDQQTPSGVYTHVLIPSAVALYGEKVIIGEGAKRLQARATELGLEREKSLFLETKNDIGAQRTYHRAPEGFRSAAEIAGKVLAFLKESAEQQDSTPISRTVVTVPASFQASQRLDTVTAAELAGIKISGGDILDEPIAAFLDYLMLHPREVGERLESSQNLVVFDFGGGTCDVAVFRLERGAHKQSVKISPLSVSRYHRLGGGDIDRAIVFEVLLPQLLEQNRLSPFDLTFEDKKAFVEPAYIGVAEALKVGLCTEINRLKSFDQFAKTDKKEPIVKRQPGLHACKIKDRELQLQSPSLSAEQFETLLEPFLDQDLLYARETEYRLTCSIFAPIQDALERCALQPKDVNLCLLVGGSSLIPHVRKSIGQYFPKAEMLTYQDRDSSQLSVARGAAYHSLALAIYGRSIFQVVTPDRISIRTTAGSYELVPEGATLPFPPTNGWAQTTDLTVPESALTGTVPLLVEIVAGEKDAERSLLNTTWDIPGPINRGDGLCLEFRIDENQVFQFRLTLSEDKDAKPFVGHIENPLSNVVNPHAKRLWIQKAEEELRTGKIVKGEIPERIVEIARAYAELQQIEKAISFLKRALQMKNRPDSYILNLLGIYHGELGDHEKQEKFYRESATSSRDGAPLFNLALAQYRRKQFTKALGTVDEALGRTEDGPTYTLKAQIAEGLEKPKVGATALTECFQHFEKEKPVALKQFDDWELGWYVTACRMSKKEAELAAATKEQKRRKERMPGARLATGQLPMVAGIVAKQ